MKKIIGILSIALVCTMIYNPVTKVSAQTSCKTSGSYSYCISSDNAADKIQPIYETQAEHQKGYSTNLSLIKTVTKTQNASESIAINAGWSFANITGTFNVGKSQSHALSSGVAYTIGASTVSGKYRIAIRFPGKSLSYVTVNKEGARVGNIKTISYVPTRNAQRKFLQKY